jgi:hypothetical protein
MYTLLIFDVFQPLIDIFLFFFGIDEDFFVFDSQIEEEANNDDRAMVGLRRFEDTSSAYHSCESFTTIFMMSQ